MRPAAGGIRRHVSDLLEHLDRRQFSPVLFAPTDFVPDCPEANIVRHSVEIGATTRPLRDAGTAFYLARLLRRNADIVHAHGLIGAVVGGFAARLAGLPYLFTVHNLLPEMNPIQSTLFRELARTASRIIAVSEAVAQTVERAGVSAGQIAVVSNGVDLSKFDRPSDVEKVRRELGIATGERMLLGVGRLAPEKGFDLLIEAFTILQARPSDIRLVIVGEGEEMLRLKAQAASLGERVLFPGHRSETAALFAAADLVVAPSRQEGQGIVPLEAMAAGRAVIAARVGGLVETIVDGVTGLLVPTEDPHALANALETLLNDPKRRSAMGEAGRRRVRQEYALPTQIQKIEALYRDVFRRTA